MPIKLLTDRWESFEKFEEIWWNFWDTQSTDESRFDYYKARTLASQPIYIFGRVGVTTKRIAASDNEESESPLLSICRNGTSIGRVRPEGALGVLNGGGDSHRSEAWRCELTKKGYSPKGSVGLPYLESALSREEQ